MRCQRMIPQQTHGRFVPHVGIDQRAIQIDDKYAFCHNLFAKSVQYDESEP